MCGGVVWYRGGYFSCSTVLVVNAALTVNAVNGAVGFGIVTGGGGALTVSTNTSTITASSISGVVALTLKGNAGTSAQFSCGSSILASSLSMTGGMALSLPPNEFISVSGACTTLPLVTNAGLTSITTTA